MTTTKTNIYLANYKQKAQRRRRIYLPAAAAAEPHNARTQNTRGNPELDRNSARWWFVVVG